jgi:hypothetical protein
MQSLYVWSVSCHTKVGKWLFFPQFLVVLFSHLRLEHFKWYFSSRYFDYNFLRVCDFSYAYCMSHHFILSNTRLQIMMFLLVLFSVASYRFLCHSPRHSSCQFVFRYPVCPTLRGRHQVSLE